MREISAVQILDEGTWDNFLRRFELEINVRRLSFTKSEKMDEGYQAEILW